MDTRRQSDHTVRLFIARAAYDEGQAPEPERRCVEVQAYDVTADRRCQPAPDRLDGRLENTALILDVGAGAALFACGAGIRLLPRHSESDLVACGVAAVDAWRRVSRRDWRQVQLPDLLMSYCEATAAAKTAEEVCAVVERYAAQIVGAANGILCMPDSRGVLRPSSATQDLPRSVAVARRAEWAVSGLITAAEADTATGAPFSDLAWVFRHTGAALVAHVPVGDGVLFLSERRGDRIFQPEEWTLLRTIACQAVAALERAHLFDQVQQLALTDPLTGLANRRHMDMVFEHALGAARRGHGLALVVIDLDGFKAINDERGHVAGDRLLQCVADQLRKAARASDLVVRYGGDEFLILLPRGSLSGALALVRRIREGLSGMVEISAGVAEFGPDCETAEQLIQAADQNLYHAKRLRAGEWRGDRTVPVPMEGL